MDLSADFLLCDASRGSSALDSHSTKELLKPHSSFSNMLLGLLSWTISPPKENRRETERKEDDIRAG